MGKFEVQFESTNEYFPVDFDSFSVTEIVTSDHTKLINRDADKQHPIKAIDGLQTELSSKVNSKDALTNFDIWEIINS